MNPELQGRVFPPTVPYLVGREKVREFARAIFATDPQHDDPAAARALGYEPADDAESYAAALIAVHGEPDLTDPVHSRVGGELATAAFDSENFDA